MRDEPITLEVAYRVDGDVESMRVTATEPIEDLLARVQDLLPPGATMVRLAGWPGAIRDRPASGNDPSVFPEHEYGEFPLLEGDNE